MTTEIFRFNDEGKEILFAKVKFKKDADNDYVPRYDNWLRLCQKFFITGLAIDEEDNEYILVSRGDKAVQIPRDELHSKVGLSLLSKIITVSGNNEAKDALICYINNWIEHFESLENYQKITLLRQTGWYQEKGKYYSFVMPTGEVLGNQISVILPHKPHKNPFAPSGSLEEWNSEVLIPASIFPQALLAIGISLAAPLIYFLDNLDGGVFHLYSESSSGKSILLGVGASVWGKASNTNGIVQLWNATGTGIENYAVANNDCCLYLDEMTNAPQKVVGNAIYTLGNGSAKMRSNKDAEFVPNKTFRVFAISNGEFSLKNYLGQDSVENTGGRNVRCFSIYTDTRGIANADYVDVLRRATLKHYGVAGKNFVSKLLTQSKLDLIIIQTFDKTRAIFEELAQTNPQVARASKSFRAVLTALWLAIDLKVLKLNKEQATNAILACFKIWLEEQPKGNSSEESEFLQRCKNFMQGNLPYFFNADSFVESGTKFVGYWQKNSKNSQTYYYVLADKFEKEMLAGFHPKKGKELLAKSGWLIRPNDKDWTTPLFSKSTGDKVNKHQYICRAYCFSSLLPQEDN